MRKSNGFTLIELVIVVTILGVVGVGIASFVRSSMQIFIDVGEREQLLTESRFAIERMSRELRNAVPNSVRVAGNSTEHCIEFVPINWSSVYTVLPLLPSSDTTLSIVFPSDIDGNVYSLPGGDHFALVYPLRTEDVYDASNQKRQLISACTDGGDGNCNTKDGVETVDLTVASAFPEESPASRAYLIDRSVSFCITNGRLVRFENDIVTAQASAPVNAAVIAEHLVNTLSSNPITAPGVDDPFRVFDSTLQANAVIQLRLRFEDNEEVIGYQKEVHLSNVP